MAALPTETAQPTLTANPTLTSRPTLTPQPTLTDQPTLTPRPTLTANPTYTPTPTATAAPTWTPTVPAAVGQGGTSGAGATVFSATLVRSTKVTVRALYIELVSDCDQFLLNQCQSYNPPDCRLALNFFVQIDAFYLPTAPSSSPVVQNAHALYLQAHAIYEQAFRPWDSFCRERVAAGEPIFTMDLLGQAVLNDAANQIDPLLHQAAQLLEGN